MNYDLYRYFDSNGALLYIGISRNAVVRLIEHSGKAWYPDITRIEIEKHPTREDLIIAEKKAIQAEKPIHNIVHAIKEVPINKPRPKRDGHGFVALWQGLSKQQKIKLCERVEMSNSHMRSRVSYLKSGKRSLGRRLRKDVAEAAYDLGYIDGDRNTVEDRMFPVSTEQAA